MAAAAVLHPLHQFNPMGTGEIPLGRLTINSAERPTLSSILSNSCGSRTVTVPTRVL
jgi:hypothetical protein